MVSALDLLTDPERCCICNGALRVYSIPHYINEGGGDGMVNCPCVTGKAELLTLRSKVERLKGALSDEHLDSLDLAIAQAEIHADGEAEEQMSEAGRDAWKALKAAIGGAP